MSRSGAFGQAIVPVWLITATWDFICATALAVFAYKSPPIRFWQGVASTALGPGEMQAGTMGAIHGVMLHLMVAFAWSAIFLMVAVWNPAVRRFLATSRGALLLAIGYGPVIWLVMSMVVIPLATGRPTQFAFRWWVQVFAHIPFVTIPLVYSARHFLGVRGTSPYLVFGNANAT